MNLLCPTCQKQLQVGEQYAGQMMKCPLCSATFTVPVLPQMPAAAHMPAPPPSPPPPQMHPQSKGQSLAASSSASEPGGYAHHRSVSINPRLIPWFAPLSLLAIFILMFFPWYGMYPGGYGVVTQSGWQTAFGSTSMDSDWEQFALKDGTWKTFYGDKVENLKSPGFSAWMIFYILLLLPALALAWLSVLIANKLLPIAIPPSLAPFWGYRSVLIGGLALGGLIFLILQSMSGFTLESTAAANVREELKEARGKAVSPSAIKRVDIEEGIRLGQYNLRTTSWFNVVIVLTILTALGAMMELWIERRGGQPLPKIELMR